MCFNNYSASKHGLKGLGYVTNLTTCVKELNEFLPKDTPLSFDDITGIVDGSTHVYLNKYGKPSDKSGNPIPRETASYLYFETGLQNTEGADIIGWFSRVNKKGFFKGVTWGTKEQGYSCKRNPRDVVVQEQSDDGQPPDSKILPREHLQALKVRGEGRKGRQDRL